MRDGNAAFRAVIADDEPAAREVVASFLRAHPAIRIVGEADNGVSTVACVRRLQPDLLFLDVQMPDRDGFDVIEDLGTDVPRGIIFVTAHDEHAVRAFEVHALDYVLKPFGRPRFDAAVERALRRLEAEDVFTLQKTLAAVLEGRHPALAALSAEATSARRPSRLAVRVNDRTLLIDVQDVDWVEADRDYVRLHVSGRTYLLNERLHAMEARLDPTCFLRIHRSTLVNLARIRELQRLEDGGALLVLDSGVHLRVARNRRSAVERALVGVGD